MREYSNIPLYECAKRAEKVIAQGGTIYQKWTCEKCGDRVVGNNPNQFHILGHHEECDHTTDLRLKGCGFMAHYVLGGKK